MGFHTEESIKKYLQLHQVRVAKAVERIVDFKEETISESHNRIKDLSNKLDLMQKSLDFNVGNQNRVLVHCAMGMSRSATVVIMYLMKKFNLCLDDALSLVKERRHVVDPNSGFTK